MWGRFHAAVPGLDRDPRPPREHVVEVQRALVRARVRDLDRQVVVGPVQRLAELRALRDQRQQVVDAGAVATQQVLDPRDVQVAVLRDVLAPVPERLEAVRADQRRDVGRRLRNRALDGAGDHVDRVLGHHAVGRVLAARDRDHPRHRHGHGVLARQLARALRLAGQQRTQPGVDAFDVLARERVREHGVDMVEHVVDVGRRRGRVRLVELPVGVRRADDPVPPPRDHEQDGLLRAQDEPGVELQPVARDDEVDALRRAHPELAALADERLHVVGPDAGRVDHHARPHVDLVAGELVAHAHAGDPLAGAQEPDHARVRGDRRAVLRGRAGDRERVARVVDLAVVVLQRADERVLAQRGRDLERLALGQVAVAGEALVPAERVVEREPGTDVGVLPLLLERQQEGHRRHEMRRQHVEQQPALLQRLAHQPEVALLEVAEPAVDELRRARRGPRGEVARLDQRDVQAARGRIERGARAGGAAADHHYVEHLVRQPRERRAALIRSELAGVIHGVLLRVRGLVGRLSRRFATVRVPWPRSAFPASGRPRAARARGRRLGPRGARGPAPRGPGARGRRHARRRLGGDGRGAGAARA